MATFDTVSKLTRTAVPVDAKGHVAKDNTGQPLKIVDPLVWNASVAGVESLFPVAGTADCDVEGVGPGTADCTVTGQVVGQANVLTGKVTDTVTPAPAVAFKLVDGPIVPQ